MFAAAILILFNAAVFAQDSRPISFQGNLLDGAGAPAEGSFDLNFGLFDSPTAMEPIWSETIPSVQVTAGRFTVRLGALVPIPLSVLQLPDLYLGITVVGDEMMSPKIPFSDVPRVSISRRLDGDISTEQSEIRIHPPDPGLHSGIAIGSLNDSNFVHLYPIHPPEPGLGPMMALSSNNIGAHMIIDDNMPGDEGSGFKVHTSDEGALMIIDDNMPTGEGLAVQASANGLGAQMIIDDNMPTGERSAVDISSSNAGAHMIIDDNMPSGVSEMTLRHSSLAGGESGKIKLSAAAAGGSFDMFPPMNFGNEPVSSMNSNSDGSWNWLMFNPQPEPPARPISDMSTGVGGEFNWVMFNPQPEPPAAVMNMNNSLNGGPSFEMTAPSYGGLRTSLNNPMISLNAASTGGYFRMYNPSYGRDDGAVMEMKSELDGRWNWNLMIPLIGAPGRPISEMSTGLGGEFNWVMFNPQPEPPAAIMNLGTDVSGPSIKMTAPAGPGGRLDITDPMLKMSADSEGGKITLKRVFQTVTGGPDSTSVLLSSDSLRAKVEMYGPGSLGVPKIQLVTDANGAMVGLNTTPSNILTVQQFSATDPIADAWTTYSSRRWKTNIKTLHNSIDLVKNLRGVSYEWKETGKKDIGLIAEEVGDVIPEIVSYEDNGIDARSVDYSRLVPVLIEATKEQQQTIEEMQAEIAALKNIIREMARDEGTVKTGRISAGN